MKTPLQPEQWRVLGALITRCGERARLGDVLKQQDASPEAVCDLAERGLIVAKLHGDEVERLTPGLIKTYRQRIYLTMSRQGESYANDDPHRVLRSPGRSRMGLSLSYMLGMIAMDELTDLVRWGLLEAVTVDDTIDLADARQRWPGSSYVILPGGAEVHTHDVIIRTTRAGQLYVERY
ncbi:hypothetical protein [Paractinoplanes atraurantiacus]|uniref:Uncharacterized protein n=1 Tax=Paractinoplanes atraurantiacus TaxID=1036182 RepID=A0A285J0C8_9ACTN|nr:hypothetical protein [Actinoplanes atraurantiacus]SNY53694.1 hypothetical protein SAMN05421748_114139 [Actinoplanes atraurantiacus]